MPLESGTYVSDLVTTNPTHTDAVSEADGHFRLIKSVLKNTFPNLTGIVTATQTALNAAATAFTTSGQVTVAAPDSGSQALTVTTSDAGVKMLLGSTVLASWDTKGNMTTPGDFSAGGNFSGGGGVSVKGAVQGSTLIYGDADIMGVAVPSGVILQWSGSTTNIPAGWVLCDGTHGTPDLRSRFVVGAGTTYNPGNFGGQSSVSAQTDTQGAHNHSGATGSAGNASQSVQTDSQGTHNHSGTTGQYALQVADIPSHVHGVAGTQASGSGGTGSSYTQLWSGESTPNYTAATGGGGSHAHPIGSDGLHSHNVNVTVPAHTHNINEDGSHAHTVSVNTLPPYLALCFIMKT